MYEIAIASLSAMKTKSILYAIMSLLLSTFWAESAAKNPYYYFRTLDIKDGLSHNTVNTILQDRQGFMWFGTKDGLNQYDGLVFRTFQKEKRGAERMKMSGLSKRVYQVCQTGVSSKSNDHIKYIKL